MQNAGPSGRFDVLKRPFITKARTTLPSDMLWFECSKGVPEVGGAHTIRPVLPQVKYPIGYSNFGLGDLKRS
jgi:hypothetical protein